MRFPLLALLILFLASACTGQAEELLPIPASIKGASHVGAVEVTYRDRAVPAAERPVFAELLERSIREAAQQAGLGSGRALKLSVEVDAFQVANPGSALIGRDDRLEGSVFLRDAQSGESLGHLYLDINRNNGGLIGMLSRIGDVRESLARQFGAEVAAALSGRKN